MSTVYVLNKDGKPLMPTTRGGHVRHLLKEQKARVVRAKPFTIQLLYETNDVVQPLYLGINNHMPYELKQFRRHARRALNNENMNRVYTLNDKAVAINRHKATEQEAASLEEFRKEHPNDVCKLKVKEHHPTYRNMNRNYPGSIFLVGKHVHIMQGIAGSKDGKATTYKDSNANSITASKCKFVAKNSGILFV